MFAASSARAADKYCANRIYDLCLLGREGFLLCPRWRNTCRKHEREANRDRYDPT